jgi:EpsI family protein
MSFSRAFLWTFLLLLGTVVLTALASNRPPESLRQPLETIPRDIAGWTLSNEQELGAHVLEVMLPTSYLSRTYQKGSHVLDLFIAFYAQQRAGESMHSPKNCLPAAGWEIWRYESATIPVAGEALKVNKYYIQNSGDRRVVFYWYQSKQRVVASEYLGKILLVRDALIEGHTAGSIVRVILPDTPSASDEGSAFSAALIPYVRQCFLR